MFILYKTTNLVNGRIYYGIHSTWDLYFGTPHSNDTFCGDTNDISADLKRYGRQSFIVESIHAFTSMEEAQRILDNFKKTVPPNSYHTNARSISHLGLQNGLGSVRTEETKKLQSEIKIGERNPMHGKRHTEQAKEGFSQFRSQTMWINNGFEEKQILKSQEVPEGWNKGRKKRLSQQLEAAVTNNTTTANT